MDHVEMATLFRESQLLRDQVNGLTLQLKEDHAKMHDLESRFCAWRRAVQLEVIGAVLHNDALFNLFYLQPSAVKDLELRERIEAITDLLCGSEHPRPRAAPQARDGQPS